LKNFSLEALTIELEALKRRMIESEEQREHQSLPRNYPTIIFRKPDEDKAEDGETHAEANENVSGFS